MGQTNEVDATVGRIEAILDQFRSTADAATQETAEELVRLLLEIYGAGLSRILDIVRQSGGAAGPVLDRLAEDRLVASLLLIHGLHPVDAETRVRCALERLGIKRLALIEVTGGVARIRVEDGGDACGLAEAIERVVQQAAPDIERVEIDGAQSLHGSPLVQIGQAPRT